MSGERRALAPMAAWNAASWVAAAAYGFAVTRLVWHVAGEHSYGVWATVGAIRGFILFLDGGLAFGVNRDAALAPAARAEADARIRASWRIYAALGVVALVASALAAGFPGLLLGLTGDDADVARGVTLVLGAETALALVASPLTAILRGRQRFDALAAASWAQTALGLGLLVVLTSRYGLIGAAWAALLSRVVVFAVLWVWMRARDLLPGAAAVPAGTMRAVLVFASPLWLAAAGTQIGAGTDVPIVGGFHGPVAAAHYALGATIPGIGAGLLFAVMGASFPRMVAADAHVRRRMAGSLLFMCTFLAAVGFGFIAMHAEILLALWVGSGPPLALTVAAICSLNWALNAPAHVLSSLAIARGEHRVIGPVVLVEAVLNIALSLALAAWWSPLGPAVGTFATIAVSNLIVVPALLRARLGLTWTSIVRPSFFGYGLGLASAAAVAIVVHAIGGGALAQVIVGSLGTMAAAALVLDVTVRGESQIRRALVLTRRGGWSVLRRQNEEIAVERARHVHLRETTPIVWDRSSPPLVTVRIATYNRGRLVADRAIASALAQTHTNVEVLVVGDCCDAATAEAVLSVKDPRVKFVNLPERGRYPTDPRKRWMVAGAAPMNHALDIARGEWIAPLDDDDEFTPDHVESLLAACRERGLEFVYGVAEMEEPDGSWTKRGSWPVANGQVVHASVMWSSRIELRHDIESWKLDEPGDWNLWHRMRDAGVKMGFVDLVVCRHYREAREVKPVPPFWSGDR